MYYRIKENVMFRKYDEYGYITDNSMFGYRFLNDNSMWPGEEYVSQSGAIMLDVLGKIPKDINSIIEKLLEIFVDVDFEELKSDAIEFYNMFVDAGFLVSGKTYDECKNKDKVDKMIQNEGGKYRNLIVSGECSKNIFNQNDFLRSLHMEVASECNERCVHCYIPHEDKLKMIKSSLFYSIIEEGRNMNIINVTLSGGEPLLHKDFV